MKHPYISCFVMLLCSISIQAMQKEIVSGEVYIDGPVAYAPDKYYKHLSKKCGIATKPYEPLIQVSIVVDDVDKNGKECKSIWTNNDSHYVLNYKNELVVNDNETRMPYGIKQCEKKLYSHSCDTEMARGARKFEVNNAFFPSYLPVCLFQGVHDEKFSLQIFFRSYSVWLQCIGNPQQPGTSFRDNLTTQLRAFIHAPRYFKWRKEDAGSTFRYSPIRILMKEKFIKSRDLPKSTLQLMTMCHEEGDLCPDYCSADPNVYQHGIEGIYTVEKLEQQFALLLFSEILIGDLDLVRKMTEIRNKRREAAKEEQ